MGQGFTKTALQTDKANAHNIPISVVFLIQVCIVFVVGIVIGGRSHNNLLSSVGATMAAYFWMFFIYFLIFEGNSPDKVFGQVFIIFLTVYMFTMIFCVVLIPDGVRVFENTVGYMWVVIFSNTALEDIMPNVNAAAAIPIIADIQPDESVSSLSGGGNSNENMYYKLTEGDCNGEFFGIKEDDTSKADKIFRIMKLFNIAKKDDATYDTKKDTIINFINTKYNVGILCWTLISAVVSTLLSMEYMAAYI